MHGPPDATHASTLITPEERKLLQAIGFPVIASDERGRITFVNSPAEALLGWSDAESQGLPLTVLMPARMRDRHTAGIGRYVHSHESKLLGRPVRVPALHKNGTEVEIDLMLRLFRRPDGSDLIVGTMTPANVNAAKPAGLVELETQLQKRAYQLV